MRKILLSTFLSIGVLMLCFSGFAQERSINGIVTSADNVGLPGVTISIKGTNKATQTDASGRYSIAGEKGQTLQFSSVGFLPQEVVIGDATSLNILLSSTQSTLSDVVVVGYATQRKGNLTGAVSSVDVKKSLTGRPIADVGRGLQGVVTGLSVTIPSGEVGSDPIMKIRGQIGSIYGGSSPLILLDNVEIPSIQVVNPNDIESITVLKDAASASIYGSKAAFGVILITTKKGTTGGKPQINYTNNFSWQNVWKDLDMADVDGLKYTVLA